MFLGPQVKLSMIPKEEHQENTCLSMFLENRIEMGGRQPSHLISSLDKSHGYVEEEERIILVKSEF